MLDSEDIGLPVIRANNINNGYVDLENDIKYWYQIDPMGANTRNYLVAKDDILINFINSESRMGSAAIMRSIPSRDTIYTTNILRLRLTSDLDPYWFYIQTQSKLYLEYIKSISKVAVNQASFTTVEFKNFTFFCPSTKEQTQIGNFFKQLDDTIALHQREFEKFKILRKAYLKHIFIDDTTQFRAEKTIPWEQRKLGDICNITTGKLDANAMVENGKYDFFTSGIKKYKIDHYAFLGPALTIAGNGATVGYMHYADGFFNAYQRTYVLTELLGDRTFLFSTINRKLQKKIQQEARAGNIPYIVLDMLTELDIYLPSLEEQIQIGNFFKQLDDTIALHQKELAKYQQIKTACLEKMFVE